MATITPTNLRAQQQHSDLYLSISKPATLMTAQLSAAPTRGQRSLTYDTGSGSGFATVATGQRVVFDTQYGLQETLVKSISGTVVTGTLELYEQGLVLSDNDPFTIYHDHSTIYPIPPAIRSGIFYKFFDQTYSDQNSQPKPVAIIGSHRAGFLSAGSIVFNITAASSYAIASGATISSYAWTCVHNGGGTSGITIASATAATTTLTLTEAGQYWLSCIVTDSNGKTQGTYRAVFAHDRPGGAYPPYLNFSIQSMSGDWDTGGWRTGFEVSGDQTLTDFPDQTLAVIWHENFFNGSEAYINLWGISDEIVTCGYLRQDTDRDNWSGPDQAGGTGTTSFQLTTPDDVLNNKTPLGSVSLNAVTTPAFWYEYASWMTTGRSIHHLLLWQAFGVFQACDVLGLTDNTLGVLQTDYTEPTLLQQVNGFAYNRGTSSKLVSDRLGRLHLVADSQMLNTAARAALDTVFTLTDADVSGVIDVVRAPEKTTTFTDLNGFAFNGTTSTPYISIIPGYRESSISYIIPENTGGATASIGNQVLASQTDSNERIGRYQALQNVNPREVRLTNPSNYMGAWDIVPSIGWYEWGIADASLKRMIELFGRLFICRHVDIQFLGGEAGYSGSIQTSVVLQPEAIGPDGIQGNYPTGYPTAITLPTPDWDDSGAGGQAGGFIAGWVVGNTFQAAMGQVGSITFGAVADVESSVGSSDIALCGLSTTQAIGVYNDNLSAGGKARVLDISGTTITPGTAAIFNVGETDLISIAALSATKAIVFYTEPATKDGKAIILDVSGSTITPGAEVTVSSGLVEWTGIARLSATKAIAAYRDDNTVPTLQAVVLDISGSTITVNTPAGLASQGASYVSVCGLDSSTAIVAYRDSTSTDLEAVALTGITTTFTVGSPVALDSTNDCFDNQPGQPFISKIDSSRAIVGYQTDSSPFIIRAVALSHSAGTITGGSSIIISDGSGYDEFPSIAYLGGGKAVVSFGEFTANFGASVSINISGTTLTNNGDRTAFISASNISQSAMCLLETPS